MSKIRKLRLSRFFIFSFLALTLGSVIFFACKKEDASTLDKNYLSLNVEKSKSFFESQQSNSNSTFTKKMKPMWDKALDLGNFVQIPFKLDSGKFQIPALDRDPSSKGREYIIIQKNNDEMKAFLIDYMPSKDFVGKVQDINIVNYLEKKFDGMISSKDLDGKITFATDVKDGKIIRSLKPIDYSLTSPSGGETICITNTLWSCIYVAWCECTECQLVDVETCYTIWTNDGGGYNGGPCSWCGDTGGGSGGCNCTNQSQDSNPLLQYNFSYLGSIPIGGIDYKVKYTVQNCAEPNYRARISYDYRNPFSLKLDIKNYHPNNDNGNTDNSESRKWQKSSQDPKCGWYVSTEVQADIDIKGVAKVKTWYGFDAEYNIEYTEHIHDVAQQTLLN